VLVHNKAMRYKSSVFEKMGKAIGKMSGNQQVANKQVKALYTKYGITNKNVQKKIHDYIH
jgi:hypothetical protein